MTRLVLFAFIALLPLRLCASSFQNLGFDEAHADGIVSGSYPASQLLPGWALFRGESPVERVSYDNAHSLAATFATLVSSQCCDPFLFDIDGSHGLYLVTGDAREPFSLVQQGDVPTDAALLSYRFKVASFTVAVNGHNRQRALA